MSFSGKKFRRIGCENIETLMKQSNPSPQLAFILKAKAPVFSYTKLDEDRFKFTVQANEKILSYTFQLGEEFEIEKLDGDKVKITYTQESENVLEQVIKKSDGKKIFFRREFEDNKATMIIKLEGCEAVAKIFYETVT